MNHEVLRIVFKLVVRFFQFLEGAPEPFLVNSRDRRELTMEVVERTSMLL